MSGRGTGTDCGRVRAAISARADGEVSGVPMAVVERHLAACPSCAAFAASLADGPLRPAPGGEEPGGGSGSDADLAARVVAAAGPVDRAGVWWVLRALLAAVAVGYLVVSVPELLFSVDPHHGHVARHLGAFELAYGVELCFVALRPAMARAMVPFTAALATAMAVIAVTDVARGEVPALAESVHLLEIAGLVLVWLLATRRGWPRRADRSGRAAPSGPPGSRSRPLHAVAGGTDDAR